MGLEKVRVQLLSITHYYTVIDILKDFKRDPT